MLGMLLQRKEPLLKRLELQQQSPLPSTLNQSKTGLDNGARHIFNSERADSQERFSRREHVRILERPHR